jgi:hypothetical protein
VIVTNYSKPPTADGDDIGTMPEAVAAVNQSVTLGGRRDLKRYLLAKVVWLYY